METQDKPKATARRQTAIHTLIYMINSVTRAGRPISDERQPIAKLLDQYQRSLKTAESAQWPAKVVEEQEYRLIAFEYLIGNIIEANKVCVQNYSVFHEAMVALMDECSCEECIETKRLFESDEKSQQNMMVNPEPKLTGPRANWQKMFEEQCTCENCKAKRASGQRPDHFAA